MDAVLGKEDTEKEVFWIISNMKFDSSIIYGLLLSVLRIFSIEVWLRVGRMVELVSRDTFPAKI